MTIFIIEAHTYLSSRALVVQRAERNGRQQDGDVEEDGCGGVLQQRSVSVQNTWRENPHSNKHLSLSNRETSLSFSKSEVKQRLAICEVRRVQRQLAAQVFINATTCSEEIFYLGTKGKKYADNVLWIHKHRAHKIMSA